MDEDDEGHDIKMYINSLNYTYTSHFISSGRLRSLSWINLGDPFTYYAIYSWFRYIASGKETHIPMISIFEWKYLFNTRLGLTPFGPEFYFENYLLKDGRPIYFYIKGGRHSGNRYGGLGIYAPRMWKLNNWYFGFRFDGFRQPRLLLQEGAIPFTEIDFSVRPDKSDPLYPMSSQRDTGLGWGGSMIFSYSKSSGFELELGLKSSGFIPGFALRSAPIARLFYTLTF